MTTIATSQIASFQAIESLDLSTVTGGYDFGRAVQAGNAAAGPGREAGQVLGSGFDAVKSAVTGKPSTLGSTIGAPVGAAVGWTGGFASDSMQQLRGK